LEELAQIIKYDGSQLSPIREVIIRGEWDNIAQILSKEEPSKELHSKFISLLENSKVQVSEEMEKEGPNVIYLAGDQIPD
jgi:hypothetical protein